MDLLQEIEEKSRTLTGDPSHAGVQAVARHIKAADRYFLRAREDRDDDLFNDVIYRTNQAFEGMLKEAYTVLAAKDGAKLSPHQIEKHLINESILTSRVLELFTNYRQQWRNPSTHDHTLFFGEQEALLAIVSVSAFTTILLDQIIEQVNFVRQKAELIQKDAKTRAPIWEGGPSLHEHILNLLEFFSRDLKRSGLDLNSMRESEVLGRLGAHLPLLGDFVKAEFNQILPNSRGLRPDFVFKSEDEIVILEVKRPGYSQQNINYSLEQMTVYLSTGPFTTGIVFLPPASPKDNMLLEVHEAHLADRTVLIHIFAPQRT